eukprot:g4235.t1
MTVYGPRFFNVTYLKKSTFSEKRVSAELVILSKEGLITLRDSKVVFEAKIYDIDFIASKEEKVFLQVFIGKGKKKKSKLFQMLAPDSKAAAQIVRVLESISSRYHRDIVLPDKFNSSIGPLEVVFEVTQISGIKTDVKALLATLCYHPNSEKDQHITTNHLPDENTFHSTLPIKERNESGTFLFDASSDSRVRKMVSLPHDSSVDDWSSLYVQIRNATKDKFKPIGSFMIDISELVSKEHFESNPYFFTVQAVKGGHDMTMEGNIYLRRATNDLTKGIVFGTKGVLGRIKEDGTWEKRPGFDELISFLCSRGFRIGLWGDGTLDDVWDCANALFPHTMEPLMLPFLCDENLGRFQVNFSGESDFKTFDAKDLRKVEEAINGVENEKSIPVIRMVLVDYKQHSFDIQKEQGVLVKEYRGGLDRSTGEVDRGLFDLLSFIKRAEWAEAEDILAGRMLPCEFDPQFSNYELDEIETKEAERNRKFRKKYKSQRLSTFENNSSENDEENVEEIKKKKEALQSAKNLARKVAIAAVHEARVRLDLAEAAVLELKDVCFERVLPRPKQKGKDFESILIEKKGQLEKAKIVEETASLELKRKEKESLTLAAVTVAQKALSSATENRRDLQEAYDSLLLEKKKHKFDSQYYSGAARLINNRTFLVNVIKAQHAHLEDDNAVCCIRVLGRDPIYSKPYKIINQGRIEIDFMQGIEERVTYEGRRRFADGEVDENQSDIGKIGLIPGIPPIPSHAQAIEIDIYSDSFVKRSLLGTARITFHDFKSVVQTKSIPLVPPMLLGQDGYLSQGDETSYKNCGSIQVSFKLEGPMRLNRPLAGPDGLLPLTKTAHPTLVSWAKSLFMKVGQICLPLNEVCIECIHGVYISHGTGGTVHPNVGHGVLYLTSQRILFCPYGLEGLESPYEHRNDKDTKPFHAERSDALQGITLVDQNGRIKAKEISEGANQWWGHHGRYWRLYKKAKQSGVGDGGEGNEFDPSAYDVYSSTSERASSKQFEAVSISTRINREHGEHMCARDENSLRDFGTQEAKGDINDALYPTASHRSEGNVAFSAQPPFLIPTSIPLASMHYVDFIVKAEIDDYFMEGEDSEDVYDSDDYVIVAKERETVDSGKNGNGRPRSGSGNSVDFEAATLRCWNKTVQFVEFHVEGTEEKKLLEKFVREIRFRCAERQFCFLRDNQQNNHSFHSNDDTSHLQLARHVHVHYNAPLWPRTCDTVESDFLRLGIFENSQWRLSNVNESFEVCATYPSLLCVPSSIPDNLIRTACRFFSKQRLPVLSWIHPVSGSPLLRSSQFLSLDNTQADFLKARDLLNKAIKLANMNSGTSSKVGIRVYDARGITDALFTAVSKDGETNLNSINLGIWPCQLTRRIFEDLMVEGIVAGNDHAGLFSFKDTNPVSSNNEIENNEETLHGKKNLNVATSDLPVPSVLWRRDAELNEPADGWIEQIESLLKGAWDISSSLEEGIGAHVHCTDGWDRTTQLVSLVQIMSDPYYRSMEGFETLITKEWIAFGHKFSTRNAYPPVKAASQGAFSLSGLNAPIFLQFLDCVWQLIRVHPTAFQYNEKLLLFLVEHSYSSYFGNFEFDSERERNRVKAFQLRSVSVWSYINDPANIYKFKNPLYDMHILKNINETWQVVFQGRVRFRAAPNDNAEVLGEKKYGDILTIAEKRGLWVRLFDETDDIRHFRLTTGDDPDNTNSGFSGGKTQEVKTLRERHEKSMKKKARRIGVVEKWMRISEPGMDRLLAQCTVRVKPGNVQLWKGLFLRNHPLSRQSHPLARKLKNNANRHRLRRVHRTDDGVYVTGSDKAVAEWEKSGRDIENLLGCGSGR